MKKLPDILCTLLFILLALTIASAVVEDIFELSWMSTATIVLLVLFAIDWFAFMIVELMTPYEKKD